MTRESQRVSSSPSMLMRGTFTPSTTIPPSLNRQNSHTSKHGYSRAFSGGASSLLSRVASSTSRNPTPRNSPPASPSHSPPDHEEIHWELVRRRLSDDSQDGYVSFPDFDHIQSTNASSSEEKSSECHR